MHIINIDAYWQQSIQTITSSFYVNMKKIQVNVNGWDNVPIYYDCVFQVSWTIEQMLRPQYLIDKITYDTGINFNDMNNGYYSLSAEDKRRYLTSHNFISGLQFHLIKMFTLIRIQGYAYKLEFINEKDGTIFSSELLVEMEQMSFNDIDAVKGYINNLFIKNGLRAKWEILSHSFKILVSKIESSNDVMDIFLDNYGESKESLLDDTSLKSLVHVNAKANINVRGNKRLLSDVRSKLRNSWHLSYVMSLENFNTRNGKNPERIDIRASLYNVNAFNMLILDQHEFMKDCYSTALPRNRLLTLEYFSNVKISSKTSFQLVLQLNDNSRIPHRSDVTFEIGLVSQDRSHKIKCDLDIETENEIEISFDQENGLKVNINYLDFDGNNIEKLKPEKYYQIYFGTTAKEFTGDIWRYYENLNIAVKTFDVHGGNGFFKDYGDTYKMVDSLKKECRYRIGKATETKDRTIDTEHIHM